MEGAGMTGVQGEQDRRALVLSATGLRIVVDMDHGYTNQVQTDYSSVAYWYQTEPHAAIPTLSPVAERLPTPTGQNALQIALVTSPAWMPATVIGLKALSKFVRGRK